ncbi:MAG TPA: hypothetical protein VE422_06220 [Terriglobia bacterium]|nr:hypothetical protein [Terriglobia bacterium]
MPDSENVGPWKHKISVAYENDKPVEYSVHFYRLHESGWYDEIRHDSHELRKGREVLAPHFHMKLRSGLKDSPDRCVEEIRRIIDNYLEHIREVIE